MFCTVLYCTILYCTALYCTALYCTLLYYTVSGSDLQGRAVWSPCYTFAPLNWLICTDAVSSIPSLFHHNIALNSDSPSSSAALHSNTEMHALQYIAAAVDSCLMCCCCCCCCHCLDGGGGGRVCVGSWGEVGCCVCLTCCCCCRCQSLAATSCSAKSPNTSICLFHLADM